VPCPFSFLFEGLAQGRLKELESVEKKMVEWVIPENPVSFVVITLMAWW
jgi:hypothetical protein